MKKRNKKIFIDDFNNTYAYKIDKDKIFNELGIERKQEETCPIVFKILSKVFISISIALSCLLMVIVGVPIYKVVVHNEYEIMTEEFKDYIDEYIDRNNGQVYFEASIEDKIDICIYVGYSSNTAEYYYFYIIKCDCKIKNYKLIIDKEIEVSNNSYGILSIKTEKDLKEPIVFSIEIDGKITEFKIN